MKNKLLGISEQLIFDKLQWYISTLNKLKVDIDEDTNISDGINNLLNYCEELLSKKYSISNTKEFKIKYGYLNAISKVLGEIYNYINNIKQVLTQKGDSLKYIYQYVNRIKEELDFKGDIILIQDSHFEAYPTFDFNYNDLLGDFNSMTTYFIYIDMALDLFGLPLIAHEIGHCWLYEHGETYKGLNKEINQIIGNQTDEEIREKLEELTCDMISAYIFKSAPYSYLINSFINFNELPDAHFEDSFRLYMISLAYKNDNIIKEQFFLENQERFSDFRKYSYMSGNLIKSYDKFMQIQLKLKRNIFVTDCSDTLKNIIYGNVNFKEELENFKLKLIGDK